ncbi:zinc finger protein 431-like [Sabethes cyaneus]|uniref:zinc finger protein 431-like n=1 Tax=Sabethes cyaneus TaxID=53552 RepID=UPI00237E8D80|nr:zinc finger protein 431-like [Sabethes cyaneus]
MRCRTGDEKLRNEFEPRTELIPLIEEFVTFVTASTPKEADDVEHELPDKIADELMELPATEPKDQNEILIDLMTRRDDELFDEIIEEEHFSDDDSVSGKIGPGVVALAYEDLFVECEEQETDEVHDKVFIELQNVPIAEMQEAYEQIDLRPNSLEACAEISECHLEEPSELPEIMREVHTSVEILPIEFIEEESSNLDDENFSEVLLPNQLKSVSQRKRSLQLPPQEMIVDQEDYGNYAIVYYTGVFCCGCDQYFTDFKALEDHCRTLHHSKDCFDVYDCELCHKAFPSLNHKKRHQSLRSVPKLFSCSLCNYVCWDQDAIDRHMKSALLHNKPMLEFDKVKEMFDEVVVDGNLCCECFQIFSSEDLLEQHYEDEHRKGRSRFPANKPNWCSKCHQIFKNDYKYNIHVENANVDVLYRCKQQFCTYRTASIIFARFHLRSSDHSEITRSKTCQKNLEDNSEHRCCFRKCLKKFKSLPALMKHVDQVHQAKQLENEIRRKKSTNVCSICNCNFGTRKALRIHRQVKQREFVCDHCGLKLGTSFQLQNHIDQLHQKEKARPEFKCDICQRTFVSEKNLQRHKTKGHTTSGGEHICNVCGKKFAAKENLWIHWRTHTSTEKFECEICKKAGKRYLFRDIKTFKRHCKISEMHDGVRKYKCSYEKCTNTYAHKPDLQRHESTVHKGVRPFVCTVCKKGFIRNRDLRLHARRHTGAKLFSCESCPASFNVYQEYKDHCKKKHGISILIKNTSNNSE